MRSFQGVTVGFPAGPSASHSQDNWQSSSWVMWSTGELRIDSSSFGLIFSPAGVGHLAAKPLGCLVGATVRPATESGGQRTFFATTNDPVHALVRFNFQSVSDEDQFAKLAQAAEAANSSRYNVDRRSSMCNPRRSSVSGSQRDNALVEGITAHVQQQQPYTWPLVISGAELYGQDPSGACNSEVLLGRGAVAFVDPSDVDRIGSYELFFYEESSNQPPLRIPIAPRSKLTRQRDDGRASSRASIAARRLTIGSGDGIGPAVAFDLVMPGGQSWCLTFDSEFDGAGFARDFCVRQRLVSLSLKTSRGWGKVGELQGELIDMQQRGFFATVQWLIHRAVMLSILAVLLYAGLCMYNDPDRSIADIATSVLDDVVAAVAIAGSKAPDVVAEVCGFITRMVPAAEVERCAGFPDPSAAKFCIDRLAAATV